MKTHHLLMAGLLLGSLTAHAANPVAPKAADPAGAFSRLKTLAGEWVADTQMGKVHVSYEIVAGGSSLLAREWGDKMPVMLTVFHVDGGRLLLTHYCMAGNQPRMEAQNYDVSTGTIDFRFLDATNLGNQKAGHMHNAKFQLQDERHFSSLWEFYEDGKLKFAENARYTRVR